MAITADGWFDWMRQVPGPGDKIYSQRNSATLYLPHSAEGHYAGWASRLFSTARLPNGRYTDYAAASVTGWINYDGSALQHYSIFASCWASGSAYPNTNGVAFENQGFAGQPFTRLQLETNARIIIDLREFHKRHGRVWEPKRPRDGQDTTATIFAHRECVRFGSDPTACESGRCNFDALMALVDEEDEMQSFIAWSPQEQRAYFIGPQGATWIKQPSVADELVRVFGPMNVALSVAAIQAIGVRP